MLRKKFKKIIRNKIIRVKIAGYILKAFINSPLIKSKNDLCRPQPKHVKPKRVLLKQGNIYFSKSKIFI